MAQSSYIRALAKKYNPDNEDFIVESWECGFREALRVEAMTRPTSGFIVEDVKKRDERLERIHSQYQKQIDLYKSHIDFLNKSNGRLHEKNKKLMSALKDLMQVSDI